MDISSIPQLPTIAKATSQTASAAPLSAEQRSSAQSLIQAVKTLNAAELFGPENELTYIKDPTSSRIVVRVINRDSHEVMFQIPSAEVLRMAEESSGGQTTPTVWLTQSATAT